MKGRDETERIPYLRVGTTILKRVLMPLSNGRNVETLIPWNVETLRQDSARTILHKCRSTTDSAPFQAIRIIIGRFTVF